VLPEPDRQLDQDGVVAARTVEFDQPGNLAVQIADQALGPIFQRAEFAPPKIHEKRVGLVRVPLFPQVLSACAALLSAASSMAASAAGGAAPALAAPVPGASASSLFTIG
jgi:hypothetical protein